MKLFSSIEALETRIAPAALATLTVAGHQATYHDVDGDLVTITFTVGTPTTGLFSGIAGAHGDQLQTVDLSAGGFDHTNLTVTVKKVTGGDGLANIGYVNSSGHDLGVVTIKGDLAQIDAGDATVANSPGLKSLTVNSMGHLGTDTQGGGASLESDIVGGLGSLTATHDVQDVYLNVTGGATPAAGTIGPVKIGGSLVGHAADHGGEIHSTGNTGAVTIGEDLHGGSGALTGVINSEGDLGNVTIGGSIVGGYLAGSNARSGELRCFGKMGAVKVAHDVISGAGSQSAYITAEDSSDPNTTTGSIVSVTIGGSLIGNSAIAGAVESASNMGPVKIGGNILGGLVNSAGTMGAVTIGGSIIGGSQFSAGVVSSAGNMGLVKVGGDLQASSISFTGVIFSGGNIAGATVGGSIFGANGNSTVSTFQEGGIIASGNLGPVTVGHDLVGGKNGNSHDNSDTGVIEASGRITSVTIGGSIIAGTNFSTGTLEASGAILAGDDIGSITVKGSILGNAGVGHGATPVLISARGQHTPGATTDLAIGKITVTHRVESARLLAGYNLSLSPVNADAQIGPVTVGGDWIASSLVAGASNQGADHLPGGGDDNLDFGNPDDVLISGVGTTNRAGVASKIASLTIKGALIGTTTAVNGLDHFGFVAQSFGTVNIAGTLLKIPAPILLDVGDTTDVSLHRLA